MGGGGWYNVLLDKIRLTSQSIKGVLWYQGETDAWIPRNDHYEADLLQLIDSFRRDLGDTELPFIYVQIGRFPQRATADTIGGWEMLREAQRRVMSQRNNVYMVNAIDLPLDDTVHPSFEGQMRLGRRLAEVALSEVYHQTGHGHSIELTSIKAIHPESENPMVRLRFRGVSGRLRAPGRPTGFKLRPPLTGDTNPLRTVYRVDFDPTTPDSLIVGIWKPLEVGHRLIYGGGMDPYVNIVDEKDMPIPAFGPIEVK